MAKTLAVRIYYTVAGKYQTFTLSSVKAYVTSPWYFQNQIKDDKPRNLSDWFGRTQQSMIVQYTGI